MTLDEKVEEAARRILDGRMADFKANIRKILVEQDRDTRQACADAVMDLDYAYARCINCKTWD